MYLKQHIIIVLTTQEIPNPEIESVRLIPLSDGQQGIVICVKVGYFTLIVLVILSSQLPVLWEFQSVEYSVVFSRGGDPVLELYRRFNYSSGYTSECIEEEVGRELEEGVEYSVQVFVDAGESGNSSSYIQTFSEC